MIMNEAIKESPYLYGEELCQRILLLWVKKGGRTMSDLAEAVGMKRGSLSNLRRNKTRTPNSNNLAKIAKVLGVSIEALTMREPLEEPEVEKTPIPDGFIKLTDYDGTHIYVRKDRIECVLPWKDGGIKEKDDPRKGVVCLISTDTVIAMESADEIIKMLA